MKMWFGRSLGLASLSLSLITNGTSLPAGGFFTFFLPCNLKCDVPEKKSIPCVLTAVLKSSPQAVFISIRWLTWRNCQQNIRCLHESLICHSLAEENTSAALMKIMIARGKVLLCLCNRLSPLQKLANLMPEKETLTVMIDLNDGCRSHASVWSTFLMTSLHQFQTVELINSPSIFVKVDFYSGHRFYWYRTCCPISEHVC